MKFSSKQNLEVPAEDAFRFLTDFDRHERAAMRRGAEITRTDSLSSPGVGMEWDIVFRYRGRERKMALKMTRFQAPEELSLHADVQGLESVSRIELVPLSRTRTRMNISTELTANTLAARLLLQSFKLGRRNLNKRFETRTSDFARELENRHAAG